LKEGYGAKDITHPGLIFIGGNLVAVESPDEGESWKDYNFSDKE